MYNNNFLKKNRKTMKKISRQTSSNYLSIKKTESESIRLSWNFKDIQKSQTNFHIFVLLTNDVDRSLRFVNQYYRSMRSGDLLGILYTHPKNYQQYKLGWVEKTHLQGDPKIPFQNKIQNTKITDINEALSFVLRETKKKKRGVCFLNIMASQQFLNRETLTLSQFQKNLILLRKENQIPNNHIISIFGNYHESAINSMTGVNNFSYVSNNPEDICPLIKAYYKSMSIPCIKIWFELDCKENISCSDSQWKNTGFGVLEKTYYGVPTCKFNEDLHFVNFDGMRIFCPKMTVHLEITHCNGDIWHCQSQLVLDIDLKKILSQTYYMEKNVHKIIQIGNHQAIMSDFIDRNSFFFVKQK